MRKDWTLHQPFVDVKTSKPVENNCIYKSLFEPNKRRASQNDILQFLLYIWS